MTTTMYVEPLEADMSTRDIVVASRLPLRVDMKGRVRPIKIFSVNNTDHWQHLHNSYATA